MRVAKGPAGHRRRKKLMKKASGYSRSRNRRARLAHATVKRALRFAKRDRRARKRETRGLWIARLSAACKTLGISYSRFIHGLSSAEVTLDRKMLADLAATDAQTFSALVALAKESGATADRRAA